MKRVRLTLTNMYFSHSGVDCLGKHCFSETAAASATVGDSNLREMNRDSGADLSKTLKSVLMILSALDFPVAGNCCWLSRDPAGKRRGPSAAQHTYSYARELRRVLESVDSDY
ncbi:hypothetical protein NPIL_232471 [Nephila pilipes]|uniref:Uncharacterized protein n=1 Tax=Nephila pilipes TaxID=299642 RepID=A0A8X6P761_NEPPI|nr:hypothetical protein NPIL_232471 [Nephila pilipes]